MRNEQYICNLLCRTLQATEDGKDIKSINHIQEKKEVVVTFYDDKKIRICVEYLHGMAIILEIMVGIESGYSGLPS